MALAVILTSCSLSPHRNQHAPNYRCKVYLGSPSYRMLHCHLVRSLSSLVTLLSEPGILLRRLSGVVAFQACIYFRFYPNDRPLNKVMVRNCHLLIHGTLHNSLSLGRCGLVGRWNMRSSHSHAKRHPFLKLQDTGSPPHFFHMHFRLDLSHCKLWERGVSH